jgi:hypothetical protein
LDCSLDVGRCVFPPASASSRLEARHFQLIPILPRG